MTGFFKPVILATAPSGDRLPLRMAKWPCLYMARSMVWMTLCSGGSLGTSFRTSAMVLPVMVMQSPCSKPALSRIFMTWGIPPALCRSTAKALPLGLRSHKTGVRLRMTSKSSMVHSTPAQWAMAKKCSTALVEPPVAMITATAFSMDFRVTMSVGLRSILMASISTLADSLAELTFSSWGLAMVDE